MTSKPSANVPASAEGGAELLLHPTPSRPLPLGTPPTPARRGRVLGVNEEGRALIREARSVWEKFARKCGNPYVDSTALLLVGRMTIEATHWEDGLVILDAIRDRLEPKSSPRRIPEWAREHGASKRAAEHSRRKAAERVGPIDPEVRAALSAAWKGMHPRTMDTRDLECCCGTILTEADHQVPCPSCGRSLHPVCARTHECVLAQMRAG